MLVRLVSFVVSVCGRKKSDGIIYQAFNFFFTLNIVGWFVWQIVDWVVRKLVNVSAEGDQQLVLLY